MHLFSFNVEVALTSGVIHINMRLYAINTVKDE